MRAYEAADEESLHARDLVAEWTGEGLLTADQKGVLEAKTASTLRTTNIYLRLVQLLFTVICVMAATGLMVVLVDPHGSAGGIWFLALGLVCYAGAEAAAGEWRLYRHGVEEGLVLCATGLLCAGVTMCIPGYSPGHLMPWFAAVLGLLLSLWFWHPFGLWYGFAGAMVFAAFAPVYWIASAMGRHVAAALLYGLGLAAVGRLRLRQPFSVLAEGYEIAEALLWIGLYFCINLKLAELGVPGGWAGGGGYAGYPAGFFWVTWVLTWCVPPVILMRGVQEKSRLLLLAGLLASLLTLLTNKPYLGWPRHSWDPMILGVVLGGAVLWVRRWLRAGPGGVRHGFTAAQIGTKEARWVAAGSIAGAAGMNVFTSQPFGMNGQAGHGDVSGSGGSGGGGAGRDG